MTIMIPTLSRHWRKLGAALLGTALLAACSSEPNTVSTSDPSANFSAYKTYAFVHDLGTDSKPYQSLETTYLINAVSREMEARGFTRSATPDVAVNFAIETQEKVRTRSVPTGGYGVGYDPYYDVYYDGWSTRHTTRIDQYTEGKLKIDLIDVEARKLVWQGSTKGRIGKKEEQNWQGTLEGAVVDIFLGFPAR